MCLEGWRSLQGVPVVLSLANARCIPVVQLQKCWVQCSLRAENKHQWEPGGGFVQQAPGCWVGR